MGDLLSKPKPVEEVMKENKRAINKAIREVDREIRRMETQQKELTTNIKKMAKKGQQPTVKIMVKDLVRIRSYVNRFIMMKTQLNAVGLKMQTMRSHQAMSNAMNGAYSCMKRMNQQFSMPALQNIMKEFVMENEKSELHQEMMDDMIDDVMGEEGAEAEEDAIYNQVMDELGLDFGNAVPEASSTNLPSVSTTEKAPALLTPAGAPAASSNDNDKNDKPGDENGAAAGGGDGSADGGTSMEDLKDRVARLQHLRR